MYKQNGVNDFKREDLRFEEADQFVQPCTINQAEVFHNWFISDLCKRQKEIKFDKCLSDEYIDKTKKYYFVPLKLKKSSTSSNIDLEEISNQSKAEYEIDHKLLNKVEKLSEFGYKNQ